MLHPISQSVYNAIAFSPRTWHQNSVCNLPIMFSRVRCEQAIFHTISNLFQCAGYHFREPFFVADLVHELVSRDEKLLFSSKAQLKDGTCRPYRYYSVRDSSIEGRSSTISICQSTKTGDGICWINVVDVAQQRQTWRARNWRSHLEAEKIYS
jgi:hypothetical protein